MADRGAQDDVPPRCPECQLDRVALSDMLPCMRKSFWGIYYDLCVTRERDIVSALTRDDRILYVVALIVMLMIVRLIVIT